MTEPEERKTGAACRLRLGVRIRWLRARLRREGGDVESTASSGALLLLESVGGNGRLSRAHAAQHRSSTRRPG
jgi:hypothetical protein